MSAQDLPSFVFSARSVIGLVRTGNEDSALLHSRLLAVADGMGGHAGGEVASSLAIKTLSHSLNYFENPDFASDSIEDLFLNSIYDIDAEIGRVAKEDDQLSGMGTTLSSLALYVIDGQNTVALLHIGDSRCYRLRKNSLKQLSKDHTILQELLDKGAITPAEALDHPQRSFLTQALMGEGVLTPFLTVFDVEPHDRFLLCSDGLSGVLDEKEIMDALQISDLDEVVTRLIDGAYAGGAPDNVTVIVADISQSQTSGEKKFLGAAQ